MASAFSHAFIALAIGKVPRHSSFTWRTVFLGMVCSVVPDLDVMGFYFGIHYGDLWGHRGLTHSLTFAALLSTLFVGLFYRQHSVRSKTAIFFYLFVCTASHGLLDAMTDGGLGVAFFSPFDTTRYFFGVRPIAVSPIGIGGFFHEGALRVLASEARWIWLPTVAAFVVLRALQGISSIPDRRSNR
ncbi:MAG TPA: metal-dependent hydrolase [Nitrospira sp.]